MIAVQFSSPGIAAGGLNMTVRQGADPDDRPRRRNGQRFYSMQLNGIAQPLAINIDVSKSFACPLSANAWPGIRNVAQTSSLRRRERIGELRHFVSCFFDTPSFHSRYRNYNKTCSAR